MKQGATISGYFMLSKHLKLNFALKLTWTCLRTVLSAPPESLVLHKFVTYLLTHLLTYFNTAEESSNVFLHWEIDGYLLQPLLLKFDVQWCSVLWQCIQRNQLLTASSWCAVSNLYLGGSTSQIFCWMKILSRLKPVIFFNMLWTSGLMKYFSASKQTAKT